MNLGSWDFLYSNCDLILDIAFAFASELDLDILRYLSWVGLSKSHDEKSSLGSYNSNLLIYFSNLIKII